MILRQSIDDQRDYYLYNNQIHELTELILSETGYLIGVFTSLDGDSVIKQKIESVQTKRVQVNFK